MCRVNRNLMNTLRVPAAWKYFSFCKPSMRNNQYVPVWAWSGVLSTATFLTADKHNLTFTSTHATPAVLAQPLPPRRLEDRFYGSSFSPPEWPFIYRTRTVRKSINDSEVGGLCGAMNNLKLRFAPKWRRHRDRDAATLDCLQDAQECNAADGM